MKNNREKILSFLKFIPLLNILLMFYWTLYCFFNKVKYRVFLKSMIFAIILLIIFYIPMVIILEVFGNNSIFSDIYLYFTIYVYPLINGNLIVQYVKNHEIL